MRSCDVLRQAKNLVERFSCKGAYARRDDGRPCSPESSAAFRHDAIGALMKVTWQLPGMFGQSRTYLDRIAKAKGSDVTSINDKEGVAAVVDLYNKAIAIAENEER